MKNNPCDKNNLFFDDMLLFLLAVCAGSLGLVVQRDGGVLPFREGQYVSFHSRLRDAEYRFWPYDSFRTILGGDWPTSLRLEEHEGRTPPDTEFRTPITMPTSTRELRRRLLEIAFVHFFESIRGKVEMTYKKDGSTWPMILNFARVIRNAFAHGGRIHFDSQRAQPVIWKSLTYSPGNEGRRILFKDMGIGDIFKLMEDVDSEVRR